VEAFQNYSHPKNQDNAYINAALTNAQHTMGIEQQLAGPICERIMFHFNKIDSVFLSDKTV
jgi:hypothetical protein